MFRVMPICVFLRPNSSRALSARRLGLVTVAGLTLASCSISTPLGPIFGSSAPARETATGSIAPHDARFSAEMTDEDWQQTQAALQIAFDGKAAGRSALWNNTQSGGRGSIAAVAAGYSDGDRECRAFVAALGGDAPRWYQGRACRSGDTPWSIVTSAPWTMPAAE